MSAVSFLWCYFLCLSLLSRNNLLGEGDKDVDVIQSDRVMFKVQRAKIKVGKSSVLGQTTRG